MCIRDRSKDLSEVVVLANKPTKRLVDNTFYVSDYQLLNHMILLLGDINDVQYLKLITKDGEVLHTCKLTHHFYKETFKDCFGNVHLISDASSTQVYISNNTIGLLDDIRISLFDSLLSPCILSKENNFYFENYYDQGQTKRVFAINKTTKQTYDFGTYSNEEMIAMMINEGAHSDSKYGGSGKNEMEDMSPDELKAIRRKEEDRIFFNTIIATKAYKMCIRDRFYTALNTVTENLRLNWKSTVLKYITTNGILRAQNNFRCFRITLFQERISN